MKPFVCFFIYDIYIDIECIMQVIELLFEIDLQLQLQLHLVIII
jgi:hypothetical protein